MIEIRQIGEDIVVLRQSNLTQYQSFLTRPIGSNSTAPLLRYTDLKGDLHFCITMPYTETVEVALK